MPGLVIGSQPGFVRVMHGDNDSGTVGANYGWTLKDESAADLLARAFRIDLPGIDAAVRRQGGSPAR